MTYKKPSDYLYHTVGEGDMAGMVFHSNVKPEDFVFGCVCMITDKNWDKDFMEAYDSARIK